MKANLVVVLPEVRRARLETDVHQALLEVHGELRFLARHRERSFAPALQELVLPHREQPDGERRERQDSKLVRITNSHIAGSIRSINIHSSSFDRDALAEGQRFLEVVDAAQSGEAKALSLLNLTRSNLDVEPWPMLVESPGLSLRSAVLR